MKRRNFINGMDAMSGMLIICPSLGKEVAKNLSGRVFKEPLPCIWKFTSPHCTRNIQSDSISLQELHEVKNCPIDGDETISKLNMKLKLSIAKFFLSGFIFTTIISFLAAPTSAQKSPYNSVYQYSVMVGSRRAYLWIPPECKEVHGIIIALSNLLERDWLEDPLIRETAQEEHLGIVWVGPIQGESGRELNLTADMRPREGMILQKMMKDFADESGYSEVEYAPFISMGHSASGHFAWNLPNQFPDRTLAAIAIKTIPFPPTLDYEAVPTCYLVGETTEWPQYRVPDPATKPGDRDFFWPVVKESALALRDKNENNLIGVVTVPGEGHFDWSQNDTKFISLYIRKACKYRLPDSYPASGPITLKKIKKENGWLTDSGGMRPDQFSAAPYQKYKGDPKNAYWFFDKETAEAAVAFEGDRKKRKKEMLTFLQDGDQLNVGKLGFAPLKFEPEQDGLTFNVKGDFLSEIPRELIGAGSKLGHATGPIKFKLSDGPAIQTGYNEFKVQFNRGNIGGAIWIIEEHPGDAQYRHAVQPGQIMIPAKLINGKPQQINFPVIVNQKAGIKSLKLNATSDSGLPVNYFVVAGPAVIIGNTLKFTDIPFRSKYPVKVTVVAYQWGRTIEPLYQSSEMITNSFLIKK